MKLKQPGNGVEAPNERAARPGGDPSLEVCCEHLDDDIAALVHQWFAGGITEFKLTGERSVYIPYKHNGYSHIKIKGAGMCGGAIRFGQYLQTGPVAPLFDYEGRRMVDVALGHDAAFVGGTSIQQAVTEWKMANTLNQIGYDAVPCLGYGSVSNGKHRSWFAVFQWSDTWLDNIKPPGTTFEEFADLAMQNSRDALDLVLKHNLVGYFWRIRTPDGRQLLKDLHPFRRIDSLNYSRVSWVMQVYHAIHITAISHFMLAEQWFAGEATDEAGLWMIRPFLPEVTKEDWDSLRFKVVAKYMNYEPENFQAKVLQDLLESNPISARLLEICPPDFAACH